MVNARRADALDLADEGATGGRVGVGHPHDTPNIARAAISAFDAGDPACVMAWDAIAEEYGDMPRLYDRWTLDWTGHVAGDSLPLRIVAMILAPESVARRYSGTNDNLARDLRDLRNAARLPVGDPLLWHLRDAIAAHEAEARRRIETSRRREVRADRYPSWEGADLIAEIEAVAGEGKRRGRAWWFVCPLHADKNPSLHVDPDRRLWHCFGCGAGGGVVDWRKAIEVAA